MKGPIDVRPGVALQLLENGGSPAIAGGGAGAEVGAGVGNGSGLAAVGGVLAPGVLEPPPPHALNSAAVANSPASFDLLLQRSIDGIQSVKIAGANKTVKAVRCCSAGSQQRSASSVSNLGFHCGLQRFNDLLIAWCAAVRPSDFVSGDYYEHGRADFAFETL